MFPCKAVAGSKLGLNGPLSQPTTAEIHLEISYIPLLSVMTLHYHRLYQISSLEANLSLQDMKQLSIEANFTGIPTTKLIIKPDLF